MCAAAEFERMIQANHYDRNHLIEKFIFSQRLPKPKKTSLKINCAFTTFVIILITSIWLLTAIIPMIAPYLLKPSSLYNSDDDDLDVIEGLSVFRKFITTPSSGVRLILFYSITCPHCRTYAPIVSEFTTDITGE